MDQIPIMTSFSTHKVWFFLKICRTAYSWKLHIRRYKHTLKPFCVIRFIIFLYWNFGGLCPPSSELQFKSSFDEDGHRPENLVKKNQRSDYKKSFKECVSPIATLEAVFSAINTLDRLSPHKHKLKTNARNLFLSNKFVTSIELSAYSHV